MISTQPSAYSEMISQDDKVPKQDSTPSAGKSPAKRSGLKSKKTAASAAQATSSSDTTPKAGNTSEAKTANIASQSLEDGRPNHLAERNDQLRSARREVTQLRERNNSLSAQVEDLSTRNKKLDYTLREVREQVVALRDDLEKLRQPPAEYATVLKVNDDESVDILCRGRKLRVTANHSEVGPLWRGMEVLLNESLNIVASKDVETTGEIVTLKEMLSDGRAVVEGRADDVRVVEIAEHLADSSFHASDTLLIDIYSGIVIERLPRPEVEDLLLLEVPDVSYDNIGGLDRQIKMIIDAVELPFLHPELFAEHKLPASKGVLLYGPPGCGKTLIAKAVANSLAKKLAEATDNTKASSYFFNIKGPELLNKFVGETERQIRFIFQRAREKSEEGWPVIVFFDEMESLFRTRGTGISSDVESTIVPQLLAEIDGVEALRNVLVIGASNREDLVDPAILRPGRFDVKIKIDRPDENAAAAIFARYLTVDLPIAAEEIKACEGDVKKALDVMISKALEAMYAQDSETEFLEVTYRNGDKEVMHFKDFASGAMIESIVRRAKQLAVKRFLAGEPKGITQADVVEAVAQEFAEHEDLPNTTNPDDWAKISGKKGEPVVFVRTLVKDDNLTAGSPAGGDFEPGHYL